jgi:hypothetical protein
MVATAKINTGQQHCGLVASMPTLTREIEQVWLQGYIVAVPTLQGRTANRKLKVMAPTRRSERVARLPPLREIR